jgi:predicted acyl esterase
MWGTSYSGFNSLQVACERPPALRAICASDDRWTDDVHWRGGALRLVDLVDYNHYMTPMSMLPPVPPVPAVWGDTGGGWREEWRRRLATQEPWLLTWLRENRDGPYWRHASADCSYRLTWPGVDVRVESTMRVHVTAEGFDVHVTADAYDDQQHVSHRTWTEHVPR